jgi:hypothetical protein
LFKVHMKPALRKVAIALLLVSAAVAVVSALAGAPSGSAESSPSSAPLPPAPVTHAESPAASSPPPPAEPTVLASWTVREDPSSRGLALGWQRGYFSGARVSTPHVMRALSYSGRAGSSNYAGSVAWYRSSFRAPRAGAYELRFHSANYLATVWLDGHRLGSHHGSYLPFAMRASLGQGAHAVVVRIDWRDPASQSRQGFHRTWFNWGGLDGSVEVRPVGASALSEPELTTSLDSSGAAHLKVSVRVSNESSARRLLARGSLVRGNDAVALSFAPLALRHGASAVATATAVIRSPALWSPRAPNLYRLSLGVGEESGLSAQVGLRQLTWSDGRMYLNGRRLVLHGATIQEDAEGHGDGLTPGDEDRLVSELKAIGANAARAQHPLDPGLLDRLDAAGIMVWQGIGPVEGAGNWYSTTPRLLAEAEQQARTGAISEQLHPSVVAWNLVDEVAGNGRDQAEVSYVRSTTRWLHAHDPTRPVAVDVWGDHPPQQPGPLFEGVDAVAETDYTGWYDSPGAPPAQLAALMRSRLATMERTFPGRVLLISEFGAESNTLNPTGAPGGYDWQASLLAQHVSVYAADPQLSGMLIWLLRDYPLTPTFSGGSIHFKLPGVRLIEGLNQKGLFTYSGKAKPAAGVIARLFSALPPG